jgi:hypothetical protein
MLLMPVELVRMGIAFGEGKSEANVEEVALDRARGLLIRGKLCNYKCAV